MKAYTMGARALTESANQFKEVFLTKMEQEKIITPEQKEEMNRHCIIVSEKGFFGKIWDKMWKKGDDDMKITVVKLIK